MMYKIEKKRLLFARFLNVLLLTNNKNRNTMRGSQSGEKLSALAKYIILYGLLLLLLYDFPLHAMIYNEVEKLYNYFSFH